MNLSEALDAALPEIPHTRLTHTRPPRLDPDLIVRDDAIDGEPIVGVFKREKSNYFRLIAAQWQLALLFDGIRSYQEIAELFTGSTGHRSVRQMCGYLPTPWKTSASGTKHRRRKTLH